ncbi:MAG: SPFH domain-containing protein [Candidatus Micrarchaeia archaeon]
MGLIDSMFWFFVLVIPVAVVLILLIVRTIRPTEKGIVERLGKYSSFHNPGVVLLIPFIDSLIKVNITEEMVNAEKQEVITADSLNAMVDAQIYFKVQSDEDSVKKSQYAVNNYHLQIVQLARTTLRAIIGSMTLTEANTSRNKLNQLLATELQGQTKQWGIAVVRAELKEIQPPEDVQQTMNKVVIAEKEKIAAKDFAEAVETQADGQRRASIKQAEGQKQASILAAEGDAIALLRIADAKAKQIQVVNESADKYFRGNAITLKRLETTQEVLKNGTKLIVPQGSDLVNVVSEAAGIGADGILPIPKNKLNQSPAKK